MILSPLHSFFLCPHVKTPVIAYSPHNTTLHKPADQDSSLLDITLSLLDGRKGVRKDERSKVNLRAKGGKIPPKKDQKRWEEGISYTSGYNHVPIFLPRYAILPCSSSFKVVGQTMARQAGTSEPALKEPQPITYHLIIRLWHTRRPQRVTSVKNIRTLVRKPDFKSQCAACFPVSELTIPGSLF